MKLPGLLEVTGHTLGIIGFGEIGTETARRARAFGMSVIYNKRTRLPANVELAEQVTYAEKDDAAPGRRLCAALHAADAGDREE